MNAYTWSLVIMYAVALIVMAICVIKDMRRSIFRGCVSLGLAMIALPLAMLLTHNVIDRLTKTAVNMLNLSQIDALVEAFPSLEESIVALVHMVAAPEVYRIVFIVLILALAIVSAVVCRVIERKKPALAKKNKAIGAALGVAFGLVMIVAYLAPTAGYAAEAPEVIHILGEYEQISHEGEEDLSEGAVTVQSQAQAAADTPLLAMVRALGGEAMFDWMTAVEINGEKTDLHTEFHALDVLGADIAALTAVPVENYTDKEYDTLNAVGNVFDESVLLRVLGAEGLSTMSRAWMNDETFLGIDRPDMGGGVEVALDAAMIILKDTTKDTIAKDIRGLTPAVSAALRVFNTIQNLQKPSAPVGGGESTPSGDGTGSESETPATPPSTEEVLDQLVDAIAESAESPETKEVLVRAGIGLVAKELGQFLVSGGTTSETPSGGESSSEDSGEGESTEVVIPSNPILPGISTDILPEGTEITQEEYDSFVEELTDFAVSGGLAKETETIVEDIKDIRDTIGIDIPDELCEQLVSGVLDSPYASLFK